MGVFLQPRRGNSSRFQSALIDKNMQELRIDDLTAPHFSEKGLKHLAAREEIEIDFSLDGIIRFAEENLDVPLYRDSFYLDRLEAFLLEGDRHGGFTRAGKGWMCAMFADIVIQRSRFEALFNRHPEIEDVELKPPIIIAGLPRSGTTNLSNIMACDSRLNVLTSWEGFRPMPSLDVLEGRADDDRAQIGEIGREQLLCIAPLAQAMYDISNEGATEETLLMHLAGMPVGCQNYAYTPEWNKWFWQEMDPSVMYRFLKRAFQALQWMRGKEGSKRWILKSPHHLAFLPSLNQAFDDARYVITHRDPASSTISNATMIAYLFRQTYAQPDTSAAFDVATAMAQGMVGGLVRDIDVIDPSRVVHVYFHDYMADTIGTLKKVYQGCDLDWTDQAQSELESYMQSHQRGRHGGRIAYNPERDFGRTRQQIRGDYPEYLDRFPVHIESEHE